jgi:hypothetical protein
MKKSLALNISDFFYLQYCWKLCSLKIRCACCQRITSGSMLCLQWAKNPNLAYIAGMLLTNSICHGACKTFSSQSTVPKIKLKNIPERVNM